MINIVNKWNDIKIWLLVLKVRFIKNWVFFNRVFLCYRKFVWYVSEFIYI